MLRLEHEQDAEILRQAALILNRENEKLVDQNRRLRRELLELRNATPEEIQQRLIALEEQLARAKQELFGDSSEKMPKEEADEPTEKPAKRGHGPREQARLPVTEQVHHLDDADKKSCAQCGGHLAEWEGQFEESEEITVVERQFVKVKHRRQKYVCACHSAVETAPAPEKLIAGGRYSAVFAIEVAVQKYLDHLPLERQARIMGREGLDVGSNTLWDQVEALARRLEPAYARLHDYVLTKPIIGMDETHWKLLDKKGGEHSQKRWQAWTAGADDAVCYLILPSRSADAAGQVLKGYTGKVVADGYGVYEHMAKKKKITLACCWAHARRKFHELEKSIAPELRKEILSLIGELYEIERLVPAGAESDDLRAQLRAERSRAVVRRIRDWLFHHKPLVLPRSAFGAAIAYTLDRWTALTRFLDDPRLPLDNNASERALRGLVVGRKNHYGSKSRRGTEVAALLYSLMESAKLNGLDPKAYLRQAVTAAIRDETIPLPHEVAADA